MMRMLPLALQGTVMLLYIILVFLVYLAPLMFTCPCIMDRHRLKARPAVIGRRGAPMVGGAFIVWVDQTDQRGPTCCLSLKTQITLRHICI